MNTPLVSFCVKSYNQKSYLVETLKGAFEQTYRPLEIVVSDDGSTDGSWDYIRNEVAKFKKTHADVSVVINRNVPNLGNLGNWQKCCELSHGELLIKADGDDISFPERTSQIVEAWLRDGKKALVVSCDGVRIDPKGHMCGEVHGLCYCGAFAAYARDLYLRFAADCKYARSTDDSVYVNRARILSASFLHVPQMLVKYCIGTGVSSVYLDARTYFVKFSPMLIMAMRQGFADARHVGRCQFFANLTKELRRQRDRLILGCSRSLRLRWMAYRRLQKNYPCKLLTPRKFVEVSCLLPRVLGTPLLRLYGGLNYLRHRLMVVG